MNNLVAKHDFNKGGAHKSLRDYKRVSMQELLEEYDEFLEEDLPLKSPAEWESTKTRIW